MNVYSTSFPVQEIRIHFLNLLSHDCILIVSESDA